MKITKLEAPDIKQWVFIRFEFLKIKMTCIKVDLLFYVRSLKIGNFVIFIMPFAFLASLKL